MGTSSRKLINYLLLIAWMYLLYLTINCLLHHRDVSTKYTSKPESDSVTGDNIGYTHVNYYKESNINKEYRYNEHQTIPPDTKLLLSGYVGGEMDLVWEIFSRKPGIFYFSEPLGNLDKLVYKTPSDICIKVNNTCRPWYGIADLAEKLTNVYECNFTEVPDISSSSLHVKFGSNDWSVLKVCKTESLSCIRRLENTCKNTTSQTAMTLDLPVGVLEILLRKLRDLKIVHIWRDPRAIIHTRMRKFPERFKYIYTVAEAFCLKMRKDLILQHLPLLSRHNVYLTRYEDFVRSPVTWTKSVFRYLGYEFTEADKDRILQLSKLGHNITDTKTHSFSPNSMDTLYEESNSWRTSMKIYDLDEINQRCLDIIMLLKYEAIYDEDVLRDLKIPSTLL